MFRIEKRSEAALLMSFTEFPIVLIAIPTCLHSSAERTVERVEISFVLPVVAFVSMLLFGRETRALGGVGFLLFRGRLV